MALDSVLAAKADFALVYLEEAHPTNGWMYESVVHRVAQHVDMQSRVHCAETLVIELADAVAEASLEVASSYQVASAGSDARWADAAVAAPPIFVDTMANSASKAFGALPERLCILLEGRVVFLGGKGPEKYSVKECRNALEALIATL